MGLDGVRTIAPLAVALDCTMFVEEDEDESFESLSSMYERILASILDIPLDILLT